MQTYYIYEYIHNTISWVIGILRGVSVPDCNVLIIYIYNTA